MQKIKLLSVTLLMCVCVVLSYAGPDPKDHRHHPKDMFACIADDLKLSPDQKAKFDKVTAELKQAKMQSRDKKVAEFKSFISLVDNGNPSDADIETFEKLRSENEIAAQMAVALKMTELYGILDKGQQKKFIDKLTPKPQDSKDKKDRKPQKPKKEPKGDKKGKMMPPNGDRPEMSRDGHQGPHQGRFGDDDRRMSPPDFADRGKPGNRDGMGEHRCTDHDCNYIFNAMAKDLKLDAAQRETFHKIKDDIRSAEKAAFDAAPKGKPFGPLEYLTKGESEQQIKDAIAKHVEQQEQIRKFALKKYFEFYGCLTDDQKNVVRLKYQYDIAKLSLPEPDDRK